MNRVVCPLAALVVASSVLSLPAFACGGCFVPPSDTTAPILQNAERILFVRDQKTKKSTAWVEIRYNGPAAGFGWVLPLPKEPKVGVGTTYLFDRLHLATAPRFIVDSAPSEGCSSARSDSGACGSMSDAATVGFATSAPKNANELDPANPAIKILQHDQVGPYDFVVISGKTADDILKWLNDNGYATPAKAKATLQDHVSQGHVFVAVKLANGKGVDEIKPISLEMDDAEPCVPLRLTAIAAVDDMAVQVFVAGPGRAIPKNHLHVQVNPARLDWLHGSGNYAQVAAAAIDEAAGRAFITEFAGIVPKTVRETVTTEEFSSSVETAFLDYTSIDLTKLKSAEQLCQAVEVLKAQKFPITKETAAILETHLKIGSAQGIIDPLFVYGEKWACPATAQNQPFNTKNLVEQLTKEFVKPLQDMGPILTAAPKLTRLLLRISPAEMTKDPVFAFSKELPDVSRESKATVNPVCRKPDFNVDAFRLTLPGLNRSWVVDSTLNATVPPGGFQALPNTATDPRFKTAPAALVVELLDETGPAKPINKEDIDKVDLAIAGAHWGQLQVPKDMVLKVAEKRWAMPVSDAVFSNSTNSSGSSCSLEAVVPASGRGALRISLILFAVFASVWTVRRRS
ncbi:MAG: DUF2330 domain-containing protein [Myxococcales bacterium]|nr:DUF2330 domain-containing protein [Myxococcales bacterium]